MVSRVSIETSSDVGRSIKGSFFEGAGDEGELSEHKILV